jgi:exopolysaccharide production protein ExoY
MLSTLGAAARLKRANVLPQSGELAGDQGLEEANPVRSPSSHVRLITSEQPDELLAEIDDTSALVMLYGGASIGSLNPGGNRLKRLVDVFATIVLALGFSPLIMLVVAGMLAQGGPILYRQVRVGRNGQLFRCLKFRTMVPDADKIIRKLIASDLNARTEWLNTHKLRDDPRVTSIGKFLRRTSFDELPQLWNVIRGDMSLVGPRPVVPTELRKYGRSARLVLGVKPGLTGLWQVSGRNDTSYRRRVAMDVYYAKYRNAYLDFRILAKTVDVVLRGGGAY